VRRIFEEDVLAAERAGEEHRRGLPRRVRFIRKPAVLLFDQDELELDQLLPFHGTANTQHRSRAWREPVFLNNT
jgi:hypothetical protein